MTTDREKYPCPLCDSQMVYQDAVWICTNVEDCDNYYPTEEWVEDLAAGLDLED